MNDSEYDEEDFLMLSGIQHFIYCRRQWALIHIEQQWTENSLTTDGMIFHSRVHDDTQRELRGKTLTVRGLRVSSRQLGVSGVCDAVEFHRVDGDGIRIRGYDGLWDVLPIEYKRGRIDIKGADSVQLCAEAMCLEEMLCCSINNGMLFWGEKHRREEVTFDEDLRNTVKNSFREMHEYYKRGYTPASKIKKGCQKCSLKDICLPELDNTKSVKEYINDSLENLHEKTS